MGSDHPNILTGKTVALCLAVRQVVQFVAAPVVLHCPALDRLANSATVSSPWRAAKATLALNAGLCFFLLCFIFLLLCSHYFRSGAILTTCPIYWVHLIVRSWYLRHFAQIDVLRGN